MNILESILVSSILGGTLLVPFVDLVTKDFGPKITYLIAFVSSVILGGIVAYIQGQVVFTNPSTLLVSCGTVFATSQTIFNLYWQSSLLREKLNKSNISQPQ